MATTIVEVNGLWRKEKLAGPARTGVEASDRWRAAERFKSTKPFFQTKVRRKAADEVGERGAARRPRRFEGTLHARELARGGAFLVSARNSVSLRAVVIFLA